MTLEIPAVLEEAIVTEAQARGLPVEDYLEAILRRDHLAVERQAIEQEQAWWLGQPPDARSHTTQTLELARNIVVVGSARDPEDGWLSAGSTGWYSSCSGYLGDDTTRNIQLSVGTHTLEYRATDNAGASVSSFVTIDVEP